jgi:serine/threonine protein kinase
MTGWIGRQIAKYEVKELVGRGGMATVYKAFHPDLERDVAIKMIHRIQCHQCHQWFQDRRNECRGGCCAG